MDKMSKYPNKETSQQFNYGLRDLENAQNSLKLAKVCFENVVDELNKDKSNLHIENDLGFAILIIESSLNTIIRLLKYLKQKKGEGE